MVRGCTVALGLRLLSIEEELQLLAHYIAGHGHLVLFNIASDRHRFRRVGITHMDPSTEFLRFKFVSN